MLFCFYKKILRKLLRGFIKEMFNIEWVAIIDAIVMHS
jgi:hypothetical protein